MLHRLAKLLLAEAGAALLLVGTAEQALFSSRLGPVVLFAVRGLEAAADGTKETLAQEIQLHRRIKPLAALAVRATSLAIGATVSWALDEARRSKAD
jgi:hypothetical protein